MSALIVKRDRNYWLAFIGCLSCTALSLLDGDANIKFILISDLNVALWLLVAWMFDHK